MLHGKEVFNFFTIYNTNGLISIFIFCILMFFVIFRILNIKLNYSISNYIDFLNFLNDKFHFLNNKQFLFIINIFLAVTFYVMIVGLSTLFNYQFSIPKIIVTFFIIIICYKIFRKNDINFIYVINSILIPLLIFFIIFLSMSNINFSKINFYKNNNNLIFSIFYGLLYFSYNSLLIIPMLFKINVSDKKKNIYLSFLFSLIIFILTLLINLLLLTFFEHIKNTDLPILTICNYKDGIYTFLYFFIILSAILSTLFSSGFAFVTNIKKEDKKNILIVFLLLSFLFVFFSFSNLINILYPIFGLIGFVQIFLILFNKY